MADGLRALRPVLSSLSRSSSSSSSSLEGAAGGGGNPAADAAERFLLNALAPHWQKCAAEVSAAQRVVELADGGSSVNAVASASASDGGSQQLQQRRRQQQVDAARARVEKGLKAQRSVVSELFLLVAVGGSGGGVSGSGSGRNSGGSGGGGKSGTTGGFFEGGNSREQVLAARGWRLWAVLLPVMDVRWFRQNPNNDNLSESSAAKKSTAAKDGSGACGTALAELFLSVLSVSGAAAGGGAPADEGSDDGGQPAVALDRSACCLATAQWVSRGGCWTDVKRDVVSPYVSRLITAMFRLCRAACGMSPTAAPSAGNFVPPGSEVASILMSLRHIIDVAPLASRGSADNVLRALLSAPAAAPADAGPDGDATMEEAPAQRKQSGGDAAAQHAAVLRFLFSSVAERGVLDAAAAALASLCSVSSAETWAQLLSVALAELDTTLEAWRGSSRSRGKSSSSRGRRKAQEPQPSFLFNLGSEELPTAFRAALLPPRVRTCLMLVSLLLTRGLGVRALPSVNVDSIIEAYRNLWRTVAVLGALEWVPTVATWAFRLLTLTVSSLRRQTLPRAQTIFGLVWAGLQATHANKYFAQVLAPGIDSARIVAVSTPSVQLAALDAARACFRSFGATAATVVVTSEDSSSSASSSGVISFADGCISFLCDRYVAPLPAHASSEVIAASQPAQGTAASRDSAGAKGGSAPNPKPAARKRRGKKSKKTTDSVSGSELLLSESDLSMLHGHSGSSFVTEKALAILGEALESTAAFLSPRLRARLDVALIQSCLRCEAMLGSRGSSAGLLSAASRAICQAGLRGSVQCLAISASVPAGRDATAGTEGELAPATAPSPMPLVLSILSRLGADNSISAPAGESLAHLSSKLLASTLDPVLHPQGPSVVTWSGAEIAEQWERDMDRKIEQQAEDQAMASYGDEMDESDSSSGNESAEDGDELEGGVPETTVQTTSIEDESNSAAKRAADSPAEAGAENERVSKRAKRESGSDFVPSINLAAAAAVSEGKMETAPPAAAAEPAGAEKTTLANAVPAAPASSTATDADFDSEDFPEIVDSGPDSEDYDD